MILNRWAKQGLPARGATRQVEMRLRQAMQPCPAQPFGAKVPAYKERCAKGYEVERGEAPGRWIAWRPNNA